MRKVFHLLPNAHLDPVWLWDWREGLNEGIQTCRTVLALMEEDPELTFLRGESAVYRHIETYDPAAFAQIRRRIEEGRWDVVGGTVVQPDTNLPGAETFARHYEVAGAYFQRRFGTRPRIAWAADSFGHAAGLPEILRAAGIEGYAFTRPFESPPGAFWWEGPGGSRLLAYRPPAGWYGCERDEMPRRLDALLAATADGSLTNVGVFFGVGNHGGGPTRRHLADIRAWAAAHAADVELVFSGLHRFFEALRAEAAAQALPVHRGELNFCLRGCYASVARFKFAYRRAEALLGRAETLSTAVDAAAPLADAWETLLFNSFHDVLPGTSIERAFDDQVAQLGGVLHAAQRTELTAVNALAARADTSVPLPADDRPAATPFLALNPHPYPWRGLVELEACLDYRPLWAFADRPGDVPVAVRGPDGVLVPAQILPTEHLFAPNLPWRARALVPAALPALGWAVYTLGWEEAPEAGGTAVADAESIGNGLWSVRAAPGAETIALERGGVTIPLSALTVEDRWGSWGAMDEAEEARELSAVRHRWKVEQVAVRERGPLRASLWVRLVGGNSWMDLTLSVADGRDAVDAAVRVLWNERSARLKLSLPAGATGGEFDVPGAVARRPAPTGEVPGGRWVRAGSVGFVSDALYNFDITAAGALRATLCRASRYAAEGEETAGAPPLHPAVDCGELRFRFALTPADADLASIAAEMERPPLLQTVPAAPGALGRSGSLGALSPSALRLLAFGPAPEGDGWIVRVQNESDAPAAPTWSWRGQTETFAPVPGRRVATLRLYPAGDRWSATTPG